MTALLGKRVVLTGAGRGLGRVIARTLVAEGAKVALLGRTLDVLVEVQQEIGEGSFPVQVDVGRPESVETAFGEVAEHFDEIDVLINCAAVFPLSRIEDASDDLLRQVTDTNFLGPIYCIRSALPFMKKAGGGNIINISSESAAQPFPFLIPYAASKAGLEALGEGLKYELREDGIRVTTLRVGAMEGTAAQISDWDEGTRQAFFSTVAQSGSLWSAGERMDPASVAATIVSIIELPEDARIDLLVVRGAKARGEGYT